MSVYCSACRASRRWRIVARDDIGEKAITHHSCGVCGYRRMEMADVTDAEQTVATALGRCVRRGVDDRLDLDDARGHLREAIFLLYLRWEPTQGVRFSTYALNHLPHRFVDWQRQTLGRDVPKPLANADSLDAPFVLSGDDEPGGRLESIVGAGPGDTSMGRSTDLVWVLTGRGSEADRGDAPAPRSRARASRAA